MVGLASPSSTPSSALSRKSVRVHAFKQWEQRERREEGRESLNPNKQASARRRTPPPPPQPSGGGGVSCSRVSKLSKTADDFSLVSASVCSR